MDWDKVEFEEIVEHSAFGPRFSSKNYDPNGNIATLRTTDLSENGTISLDTMPLAKLDEGKFSHHFLEKDDIIITRSGRIGTTAIFKGYDMPVLPGAFLIRFRLKDEVNPHFYTYWFNSPSGQDLLYSIAKGAAQQNLSSTNILGLNVPKPPIQEQNEIVSILSTYDEFIQNNKRRIQLLEKSARLLYKEWFVQLRFPGHEHTKIVNGVPKGWEIKKLSKIATISLGQSPKSIYYNENGEGLPFHQGVTDFGFRYPINSRYCTVKKRVADQSDILFSVRAPVGRLNITKNKIVIGRGLASIKGDDVDQSWLYYCLKEVFYKENLMGTGAIFAAIGKSDLQNVEILIPNKKLHDSFIEIANKIDRQIFILDEQLKKLQKVRNLLLPKLMNRDIPV